MKMIFSKPAGHCLFRKITPIFLALMTIWLTGCGPEAIVLRSGLDTPAQHVANGNRFLKNGKTDAAIREFNRALELAPNYSPAYVGLAIVKGQNGDIEGGLSLMDKADKLAKTKAEIQTVDTGFCTLYRLKRQRLRNTPSAAAP